MGEAVQIRLDELGRAALDGEWQFYPGSHERGDLDRLEPDRITVPGLWEAQGHVDLDGPAWYRRRFQLADPAGFWTLRFGAVMDLAEVYLNGRFLGRHEHPFTPFEVDPTRALVAGENVLDVRVTDPTVSDPEHIRLVHGKQGWANHVFPSRPSLYLTYGGIWQPVALRRHGRVVIRDAFVNGDPGDLTVSVDVANMDDEPVVARVGLRAVGLAHEETVRVPARGTVPVTWRVGRTGAAHWRPDTPVLHDLLADAQADGSLSDQHRVRFGLRTVRLDGDRMLINDVPYRMKSVLVQGFTAEELYAEGGRVQIEAEVRAARDMGFNTLRLHIKAFDPTYLDVCDELGMLLHCDLPVAEPIAHDELGDGTVLSRRATEAVTEQVRRDRNHPSIVLWSAMNELGLDRAGTRDSDVYEQFARTLYAAVTDADPTRPVIENDWVEPDPDRVFGSPVLTAHWYGRLHADYLVALDDKARRWSDTGRPLFVTEFGDWGLPSMPALTEPPFWDTREIYAAGVAWSRWPGTVSRFITETQRYQGVSDRLQAEVFRRHDHIGGYCLTELTDVPHELNGLLDLQRRPKPAAVTEITRLNQPVLPILALESLVVTAGSVVRAPLFLANDGPALDGVEVQARFGGTAGPTDEALSAFHPGGLGGDEVTTWFTESVSVVGVGRLPGYRAGPVRTVAIIAPQVPGNHDLLLIVRRHGEVIAANRYPIHVVAEQSAPYPVQVLGAGTTAEVLRELGARPGDTGPTVVTEGGLDDVVGAEVGRRLASGATVVLLAQQPAAAAHYPVPTELVAVQTKWGSSVFHFTTDSGALPSFPRRNLIVGEDSTVQATSIAVGVDGALFPDEPVVIAYKPMPGAITGTVVGAHRVGPGRLILCQYRLVAAARRSDPAARALLADLLRWAAEPRPAAARDDGRTDDGRTLTYYTWDES